MTTAILRRASALVMMGSLALSLSAEESRGIRFGLSGGWSWGTSWEFGWKFRGHSNQYDGLKHHFGIFAQLPLTRRFDVQLAADYQAGTDKMTWYFSYPGPVYSSVQPFHFISVSLNGVYEIPVGKRFQVFVVGGGGPSWGDWINYFEGTYFHLDGGMGIRLALSPNARSPSLLFGGVFRYLFDRGDYSSLHASYLRVLIGIGI
jgi:hypothetical protein